MNNEQIAELIKFFETKSKQRTNLICSTAKTVFSRHKAIYKKADMITKEINAKLDLLNTESTVFEDSQLYNKFHDIVLNNMEVVESIELFKDKNLLMYNITILHSEYSATLGIYKTYAIISKNCKAEYHFIEVAHLFPKRIKI